MSKDQCIKPSTYVANTLADASDGIDEIANPSDLVKNHWLSCDCLLSFGHRLLQLLRALRVLWFGCILGGCLIISDLLLTFRWVLVYLPSAFGDFSSMRCLRGYRVADTLLLRTDWILAYLLGA